MMTYAKVETRRIHPLIINDKETRQHLFCLHLEDILPFVMYTVQFT
jgi:hypothetical protein